MLKQRFSLKATVPLVIAMFSFLTASQQSSAQTETILHNFNAPGQPGGLYPNGELIADSGGNLYGTTAEDGNGCTQSGCGTVFELVPGTTGKYTEKALHAFSMNNHQPWGPHAGVTMDASGSLYGTTHFGGSNGAGTVFKLTLSSGVWKESLLHSFGSTNDGGQPEGDVVVDAAGNIYGTTSNGGSHGQGEVYEIHPTSGGGWTEKVIHSFDGNDGAYPYGQLLMDNAGNLYGTTSAGNTNNGTLFELSPGANGTWTETVLFNFSAGGPGANLTRDAKGNFYGVAGGGNNNGGVVWEISLSSGGTWTQQILYNFCSSSGCPVGLSPVFGVVFDSAGNLYGTTYSGGAYTFGTAYELSPTVGGWTATLLHSFGNGTDGGEPYGLLLSQGGDLYGVTTYGGTHGYGTVFRITP